MKQFFYTRKSKLLLFMLLAFFAGGVSPTWADELTVYDGAGSSTYYPVHGNYADTEGSLSEYIIPTSSLTAMKGSSITKMTFYITSVAAEKWTSTFTVYMKEISGDAYESSSAIGDAGATVVYTGELDGTASTMDVNFTTNFDYNGGNLLIGFKVTDAKSIWKSATFKGETQSGYTAFRNKNAATREKFLPKTTFTYSVAAVSGSAFIVKDGSTKLTSAYSYNFGLATAGTTKVFTLSNPGTEATPISVDVTGANGFTATVQDNATSIPAGGEKTLTITMPDATASGSIVVTPTGTGLNAFTFNVSGTKRVDGKIYIDFDENALPATWTLESGWSVNSTNHVATIAGTQAYIRTPEITSTGESMVIQYKGNGTVSWYADYPSYRPVLIVYTSADNSTWDEGQSVSIMDNDLHTATFTIPSTAKYIAIAGKYLDIDYIYGCTEVTKPLMTVTQPAALDFGLYDKDASPAPTKTFTIANTGTATLNGISVSSANAAFTITNAPTSLAAGESQDVTITMATGTTGALSSLITVSATDMTDATFTVTGTVKPTGMAVEDFSDGLPANWTNASWTFANGEATGKSSSAYLTTPKLSFSAGDFIIIKAKRYDSDTSDYLTVQGSSDNGSTWTAYSKKLQNADGLSYPDYGTMVLSDIPTTVNKLRFVGYYVIVDEIHGLTYSANDPKMGIYTDADCTVAATTSETKDFGFVTETQTATYYIKNVGTGTMTLALGDQPAGFTQALDKTSVAAGEKATLTITMPVETKGYRNGTVTVNATDLGAFTVAVSGIMVDENKLNLDFTTANIPATWTTNNWSKNANGYIETTGYSSTSLETANLTAAANESLVVVAKQLYSSSSYTFGVKYREVGTETWNDLIAAQNIGTSWVTLAGTITTAGDYELQFTGNYTQIKHIYGLTEPTEPVMVVYDGENVAANTYDFGNVSDAADATHTFTVKNEGKAVLAGLTATLSGEQASHYNVSITGLTDGNLAANASATITVKQLKDNLGAHAATLTISSTSEGISDFAIALSGKTRDASKMYVDFAEGVPTTWTATGGSWTTSSGYAQAPYSGNVTLTSPALSIAAGESLTVDLSKQYNNNYAVLTFRYTTDGGITWSEQDLSSDLTYGSFTTKTLSLGNEEPVIVFIQFVGTYYARIDNIYGGTPTTAPLFTLATSETLTDGKYDFGQSLQAAPASKVFTITNNGNADLVSDIAANDDVEIALSGEDVTIKGSQVKVPAGKTATLTVSLKFNAAAPGSKTGSVTIDSNDPVADVVLNFTANVLDATASNVDFANNATPAGWYNSGFTIANGYASNNNSTEQTLITELLKVSGSEDELSYDAYISASWATSYAALEVSYSTDRKSWTPVAPQPTLTTTSQTFTVNGLKADNYYLKFTGKYVNIDNIIGWHKQDTPAAHDLYLASATLPTETVVPGTEYTATVNVASLRANETVKAELYFGETKVGEISEDASISNGETKTIAVKGNVPATETDYDVYVKVYNANVNVETEKVSVVAAHTRTLSIASFTRTDGTEGLTADENNKISPAFSVTVENTGTTACTPTVKIYQGETVVATATADAAVAAGETSDAIALTATNMSAGEGGDLEFTAKAFWTAEDTEAKATSDAITINVTATAPKFALYDSENAKITDGTSYDLGIIKGTKSLNFTVKNEGNAPMLIKSITTPSGYTLPTTVQAFIAAQQAVPAMEGYNAVPVVVNLTATEGDYGKKEGDLVVTYKVDESTDKTFTLHLSGRTVAADTWVVDFEDGKIPADWDNSNSWTVSEVDGNHYATLTGWDPKSIMTPRLAATASEELTFDVLSVGNSFTYAYSTNKTDWSDEVTVSSTGEQTFTAPAAGNYYLRFTTRNGRLDNLVGFKLNPLEHDTEIAASSVPTSGTQYADYTATVTLKENVGKAEEITATLYVDGVEKATKTETITANGSTVVTLTWEPDAVISTAVKAYIAVTGTGIDLTTEEVDLTIAAPYTLDETVGIVVSGTYPALILKRQFSAGWNTVCLPFAISDVEGFFGTGAKAYNFSGYNDGDLTFSSVSELSASYPYIVYVPASITEDMILNNITIASLDATASYRYQDGAYFRGTYAPVAAGDWTKNNEADVIYGVTPAAKIAKAGASATMKGFRAYFDLPAGASARLAFFDEITGIKTVIAADELNEGTYNLKGQRVENLKKGNLYIKNGKKVVK